MTSKGFQVFFVFLTISLTWGGARAQSICTNELLTMFPCLNYITGDSMVPDPSCCSALANVVQTQPQCLCEVLDGSAASALGIPINQTHALELPGSCNVQTPPLSLCDGGGSGTAAAPSMSPTANSGEDSEAPSEAPSVSHAVEGPVAGPTIAPASASNGSIVESSLHLLAFVVSFTSAFALF